MINFIYRNPGRAFSIENVFDPIYEAISRNLPAKKTALKYHRANAKSLLMNMRYARKNQSTINHITGDVHYAILGLDSKNCNILTVHDLVTLEYLSGIKNKIAKQLWYIFPMRKAQYITAISQKTAKDLVALLPEVENKIHVIYDPVSGSFEYQKKWHLEKTPKILHIGTKSNKNLERVIQAVLGLDIELTIIGKLTESQKALAKKSNINFVNKFNLSKKQIVDEYIACDIVVFPSLYEGFGLPIVEAQATGRAVITSNREPMKEVAGDAALFVDPENIGELRAAIIHLIENKELRLGLVEKGLRNKKRFEVGIIAGQYARLYQSYLEQI